MTGHICWQSTEDRRSPGEAQAAPAEIAQILVHVASYVGAAAAGGVIGNRADAIFTAVARRMFTSVDRSWHQRTVDPGAPLTREEAVEAAVASAVTRGYGQWSFQLRSASQGTAHSWIILLEALCPAGHCRDSLRAHVPAGDPFDVTIILFEPKHVSRIRCAHCL